MCVGYLYMHESNEKQTMHMLSLEDTAFKIDKIWTEYLILVLRHNGFT